VALGRAGNDHARERRARRPSSDPGWVRRASARLLAAAALTAGLAAAAAPAFGHTCAATDPVCFDALPPDSAWEESIGLPAVPNRWQGDNVTVASIDTGVTPSADLGNRLLARIDFTDDHDGIDTFGHGTHIAGLIAGDGTLSDEAFEGAAPEANLVSVKVAGWDGATDASTVIAALRWVVSNGARYGIRVVNLSWGTDSVQPSEVDPLNAAVERAWRAGLVVVLSAGNAGPAAGTVTKPGDDPFVITVGAADTGGTADPADDAPAAFSSRGRATGGVQKPDVLAPGVSMVSGRAPGSTIDTFRPEARLGTTLFKGSGTSQAAAVVSGVVARMLEASPGLRPGQVKTALTQSTGGRLAGPAGGAGLVNAAVAVSSVAERNGRPPLPDANAGAVPSSGLGSLGASRGTHPVAADPDGNGVADMLSGEVDALGSAWEPGAVTTAPWTPATWALSPWAPLVAEIAGSRPAPRWTGPPAPLLAWETAYWGARSPQAAAWDSKYWASKYWGSKYWGTGSWQ
jgi:serine protease AprX